MRKKQGSEGKGKEGICGRNREEKGREGKGSGEETIVRAVIWSLMKLVIMGSWDQVRQ